MNEEKGLQCIITFRPANLLVRGHWEAKIALGGEPRICISNESLFHLLHELSNHLVPLSCKDQALCPEA